MRSASTLHRIDRALPDMTFGLRVEPLLLRRFPMFAWSKAYQVPPTTSPRGFLPTPVSSTSRASSRKADTDRISQRSPCDGQKTVAQYEQAQRSLWVAGEVIHARARAQMRRARGSAVRRRVPPPRATLPDSEEVAAHRPMTVRDNSLLEPHKQRARGDACILQVRDKAMECGEYVREVLVLRN
jgi:hypothetical protein